MIQFSRKQQQLQDRDTRILNVARGLVLEGGYHGLTMDQIAKASGLPKGTIYHRFASKEDVLVTLATERIQRRTAMMRRAAAFDGRPRECMVAVGEAVALFSRRNVEDSRILHAATGPSREKASPERMTAMMQEEKAAVTILCDILHDAIQKGDLNLDEEAMGGLALGLWGMIEGVYTIVEAGACQFALSITDPYFRVFRVFNRLTDAYDWRPLSSEWDYEETLVSVRKQVFPVEAQELYGEGNWYGDRG